MNEEDAQTAALQEYLESNTPAGYGASFRAGWDAGRTWERRAQIEPTRAVYEQGVSVVQAEIAQIRAGVQEAVTVLDFEANLGPPEHQAVLREVIRQLTEALG